MANGDTPHLPRLPRAAAADSDLERAKTWWKDYGRAITAGAVIGLSAVVGFNYWQHREQTRAEAASDLFANLNELLVAYAGEVAAREAEEAAEEAEQAAAEEGDAEGESEGDGSEAETTDAEADTTDETEEADEPAESETAAAIKTTADELMADYASTPYAAHAAFALAKVSVDSGDAEDLPQAARALEWILANADDDILLHIARLRLASVYLAQADAGRVIALLEPPADDDAGAGNGFSARYHELIGDAHLQNGDAAAARAAYEAGLERLSADSSGHFLLKLKLDNLGG